jgi:hypothetical protein
MVFICIRIILSFHHLVVSNGIHSVFLLVTDSVDSSTTTVVSLPTYPAMGEKTDAY